MQNSSVFIKKNLYEIIAIVVILTLSICIVIRNLQYAHQKAKDIPLLTNLHILRGAVAQFYGDTGLYPAKLSDLNANPAKYGYDEKGQLLKLKPKTYMGPYFGSCCNILPTIDGYLLPVNPYAGKSAQIAAHWRYDGKHKGEVHPAIPLTGKTIHGVPYQEM